MKRIRVNFNDEDYKLLCDLSNLCDLSEKDLIRVLIRVTADKYLNERYLKNNDMKDDK